MTDYFYTIITNISEVCAETTCFLTVCACIARIMLLLGMRDAVMYIVVTITYGM